MSDELPEAFPAVIRPAAEPPLTVIQAPDVSGVPAPPTTEHVRGAEAVFAQRQGDHGAGLVWAASAGMLLHDILKDTFEAPADEDDDEAKDQPKKCKH
jgi:hypothetical protein